MKKIVLCLLCVVILCSLSLPLMACSKIVVIGEDASLYSDLGYVDYATTVDVNAEKYPILENQGLFLITGYDSSNNPIEQDASDENVISEFFDPTLPTLINVLGVQLDAGRYGKLRFWMFNHEGERIDMGRFFKNGENIDNQRWNLVYFHYERFADAVLDLDASAVELRVWTRGANGEGNRFLDGTTESEPDALSYSLSEFFAAEYIRMVNAICSVYDDYAENHEEIRLAGHSMGGCLSVATMSLLNILVDDKQLQGSLLPSRLVLLDSYVGALSRVDYKIAWSNKTYIDNSARMNYICSLENIVKDDKTVVEFYYNEVGFVPFFAHLDLDKKEQDKMLINFERINKSVAMIELKPGFHYIDAPYSITGHDAIKDWYFRSYLVPKLDYYAKDDFVYDDYQERYSIKPNAKSLGVGISAAADSSDILAMKGKYLQMVKYWGFGGHASEDVDGELFWLAS